MIGVIHLQQITRQLLQSLGVISFLMLSACGEIPLHLQPTGHAITAPEHTPEFSTYMADTREQLQRALEVVYARAQQSPFGENYPLSRALEMRSPFEIRESSLCAPGSTRTGYLLLHGLTDSPYLVTAVARSLSGRSACSVVRSVLLPGHGTSPGDSLEVHRDQWRDITRYGVESFQGRVDELYLVGYSAGATLAVEYADQHRDEGKLAGLILLSPALALPDASVVVSPYLRWFMHWLGVEQESDAAKYETLAINAGAEFYLLVNELNVAAIPVLDLPVFMVISGADATVDVSAAERFFCENLAEGKRALLWYQSSQGGDLPALSCPGTFVESPVSDRLRVISSSHVGVTMPPNDPHYGVDAGYRQCLHYSGNPDLMNECKQNDKDTLYGERSLLVDGFYEGRLMRRATFNPMFAEMMAHIDCFLSATCER